MNFPGNTNAGCRHGGYVANIGADIKNDISRSQMLSEVLAKTDIVGLGKHRTKIIFIEKAQPFMFEAYGSI